MSTKTLTRSAQLAAAILASAFIEDPVLGWFVREDRGRSDALQRFFSVVARLSMEAGALIDIDDDGRSAALWFAPGNGPLDLNLSATVRLLPDMVKVCSLSRIGRLLYVERMIKAARAEKDRHWYLYLIGVVPEHQRQGLGSALLEQGLVRADQSDAQTYLETGNIENIAFYKRSGFSVAGVLDLSWQGPKIWQLQREPKTKRTPIPTS